MTGGIGRQEEWRGRGAPLSSPNPGHGGALCARPLSLSPRLISRSSVPSPPQHGHVLGDSPPSPISLNAGNPLIPVPPPHPLKLTSVPSDLDPPRCLKSVGLMVRSGNLLSPSAFCRLALCPKSVSSPLPYFPPGAPGRATPSPE